MPRRLAAKPRQPGAAPVAEALCRAAEATVRDNPDVRAVLLFGSRARGEHRPDSDWDLAFVTGRNVLRREAPEGFRPPPEEEGRLDPLQISADLLREKANALAHISRPIVQEGVLVAGSWKRPETKAEAVMERDEYGNFLGNAIHILNRAAIEAHSLPHAHGPFWDARSCIELIALSADAAEHLVKAMLGRLGVEFRRTHDLEALAGLLDESDSVLARRVRAMNGGTARDHVAAYFPRHEAEDGARAMDRLASTAGLLADELRAAAADSRFRALAAELAPAAAAMLTDRADALRQAGPLDGAEPLVAAVAELRSGLADALGRAAAAMGPRSSLAGRLSL